MFKALLLKEWVKLRFVWWLPFLLLVAVILDFYWTLIAVQINNGNDTLWTNLLFKETPYFLNIKTFFIFSGVWLAAFQFYPECSDKRLRVFFHLPIDYKKALSVIFVAGLVLLALLFVLVTIGFLLVCSHFNFPDEIVYPMIYTYIPWALAGVSAWCATASVIAETSMFRKIVIGGIGYGFIEIITQASGFNGMSETLWIYTLVCIPWAFVLVSSSLRIKEGK